MCVGAAALLHLCACCSETRNAWVCAVRTTPSAPAMRCCWLAGGQRNQPCRGVAYTLGGVTNALMHQLLHVDGARGCWSRACARCCARCLLLLDAVRACERQGVGVGRQCCCVSTVFGICCRLRVRVRGACAPHTPALRWHFCGGGRRTLGRTPVGPGAAERCHALRAHMRRPERRRMQKVVAPCGGDGGDMWLH